MLKQLLKTSLYLLLLSGIIFFSCKSKKKVTSKDVVEVVPINEKYKDYKKGTIEKFEVDGCSFIIRIENESSDPAMPEERLNPINLDDAFKQDGLKVWVKYISQKEVMTTCMSGEVVKLTAIEKR